MSALVDRVMQLCRNTRAVGRDYWLPINNIIREKRVKGTLATRWGRFKDQMRIMTRRADLTVRSLLARLVDGAREGSALETDSSSTSHGEREFQGYRHWRLNELRSPVDYLAKCRRQSLDDDTRVVLQGEEQSDYINASYIEGYEGPRVFIATQGPKESNERTIDDFWRMVWQNKSNVIVMLGNLVEGGRSKVSQYWPDYGVKQKYGQVEVEKKSVKQDVNWIRRHLVASQGNHSRDVVQYQYMTWPDHAVPDSPYGAARMVRDMLRWLWSGPPVIHCSAGLGRTGTFLLVLRLLEDMQHNGSFKPLDTLRSIRKCRANLVDNQYQYRFAHYILLEMLYGKKTRLPVHKHFNRDILSDQYKDLDRVPSNLTYKWARSHDANLNRDITVLPPDGRQIALAKSRSKQYVNAVRVRGSNLCDTFLVTEHPMTHTMGRCWRLAHMTRALAWVFLHHHWDSNEDYPSVLPPYGSCELEGVTVELTGKDEKNFFTERSIRTASKGESHKMRVFHFKNWTPTSDLPSPPQSLIFLMMRLQEIRKSSDSKVIMISCSDGYSASGVFVCLMRVAAEIHLTRTVDVYRTVQSMRFDRPQFVTSQAQYNYLNEAAIVYFKMLQLEEQKKKKEEEKKQAKRIKDAETEESELGGAKERKEIDTMKHGSSSVDDT
ncbi:receptor-type tyrosine-protein phosphatase alpha-like isoform X2 [Portunus trituberculatus]|uniref:receptor-type tyrosine-protein phosphatase alpha-like isoform X2 n=1 Tax=Portunus trituberculatus TaxID=210409 RepID=UPI001E1D0925|nr:receptor-type tyrosine-protein phosphatase alpha-like isoform X2 [Portunus trituberculatus]